jgi:hypothetical protein
MNRLSIHFKPNGFINSIRMTSQFNETGILALIF